MEKHPETAGKGNSSLKPILKKWKGLDRFTKVEGKVEGKVEEKVGAICMQRALPLLCCPYQSLLPGCSAQGQCQQASEFRCGCEGKFDQSAV